MPAATLISIGAIKLGLSATPRAPLPGAAHAYELRHLFTTQNGSWDPSGRPYDVPDWARLAYLKAPNDPQYFDDAGGDHHLFARVEDEQGNPLPTPIRFWSRDGQHIESKSTADKKSGWANIPIWSSFSPDRAEQGPWLWGPDGALAVAVADGGGLPNNEHVSSFAVWRRVALSTGPEQPTGPDQPPPPSTIGWRPVQTGEVICAVADGWIEFTCQCGQKWVLDGDSVGCICGREYRVRHYLEVKE
jgi:hypothetical protein